MRAEIIVVRPMSLAALLCLSTTFAASADQTPPQPEPAQAGAGMTPAPQDTPSADTAHVIDVKCASVAAAAVASARKASSAAEESQDGNLVQLTRARAQVSGAVLGESIDRVNKEVDDGSAKILRNLTKTDGPAELKQEQLDLGRVLIECAILQTKR